LSCVTDFFITEHIPQEETALAAHAFTQTLCPALQATAAAGAPRSKVTAPKSRPAAA